MSEYAKTKNIVREYYGKVLSTSDDLKTSACCTLGALPAGLREALANVHEEVRAKYYGCGFVAPEHLEGGRVSAAARARMSMCSRSWSGRRARSSAST